MRISETVFEKEILSVSPKISVLVPVYNVEKYVARCLRSLFANTIIADCEVIIVDDCSPDDSMKFVADVLNEFPALAKNVVLRSHDCNRGLAAARNTALLQAHGKYIICVDSDDWVEPDYLEKLYNEAENSGADIVGCDLFREYKNYNKIQKTPLPSVPSDCLRKLLEGNIFGFLHEKFFKASLFDNKDCRWIEGIDFFEDLIICTKLFYYANKISYISAPLYHYNMENSNSISIVTKLNEKKIEQIINSIGEVEKFLNSVPDGMEYRSFLNKRKALTKVWILMDCEKFDNSYLMLYANEKLSNLKTITKKNKFILKLCDLKIFALAKCVIFLYRPLKNIFRK